jgi:fermentation-respiration switch protein FrsA (DUF1100 family)
VGAPPADLSVVTTSLSSESGSELATWYVPNEKAHATIVLLHPIRGDRRSMLGRAKLFHEAGYAIVMIDLQAHGESPGRYITAGFLERFDVMAAIDFARTQNPNHRIGIVGCSLGGAASLLAGPLDIDALVLESVYPTISEAVHDRIAMRVGLMSYVLSPVLLCQLKPRLGISSSELRPIDYVSNVGCPILIAGGDVDEHTTIAETQRLFDAAAEPKKLVIFKGADHTDLLHYDRDQYGTEILSFLNTHLNASNK